MLLLQQPEAGVRECRAQEDTALTAARLITSKIYPHRHDFNTSYVREFAQNMLLISCGVKVHFDS